MAVRGVPSCILGVTTDAGILKLSLKNDDGFLSSVKRRANRLLFWNEYKVSPYW
jgi:hypothetical protein